AAGARFSRLCRGCNNPNPPDRVILTACRHAVCRACAAARATNAMMECPDCVKHSFFLRLYEEERASVVEGTNVSYQANDASTFSRACGVCYAPNPAVRAVVKTSGHIACLACIEQLKRG
ncbi:hypothetical protein PENTCL1PPCAC_20151, partial [Pristionchus entomophagus]